MASRSSSSARPAIAAWRWSPASSPEINSIKDLKGKKVAIWPGSTQEVVILDRLSAEGMTIKDIKPIRVSFSDMAPALERGDIDAYVGAEPAAGISLAKGVGKIVEYPYSTPTGSLNMVLTTRRGMIEKDPELIRTFLSMHRKASEYAMSHREDFVEMAMKKLGQTKALDRESRAECRTDLEHRRPVPQAGALLRHANAGQEADPAIAGLQDIHRSELRESHRGIVSDRMSMQISEAEPASGPATVKETTGQERAPARATRQRLRSIALASIVPICLLVVLGRAWCDGPARALFRRRSASPR